MNFGNRRQITEVSLLLMESLWVYAMVAALVTLFQGGDSRPTFIAVLSIVFGAHVLSRVLTGSLLSMGFVRIWGVLLTLLLFYAILRIDFYSDLRLWDFSWADQLYNQTEATLRSETTVVIAAPLLWLIWVRGVTQAQQSITFDAVISSFAGGLVVIGIATLLAEAGESPAALSYVGVPYIALGLLTIGLAHAARAEDHSGKSFASTWLAAIGGSVVVLAIASLLFILIDYHHATSGMGWIWDKVTFVIGWAIYIVIYPAVYGLEGIRRVIGWFLDQTGMSAPDTQGQESPIRQPSEDEQGRLPGWINVISVITVASVVATIVFIQLMTMFDRFKHREREGEVRESTYSEGRTSTDLGTMLGNLLGRLRQGGGGRLASDPIRRLYFDMLALAERRGVERQPPETPLELSPRLGAAFATDATAQITALFDESRYGGRPAPDADVRRLRAEIEHLGKTQG